MSSALEGPLSALVKYLHTTLGVSPDMMMAMLMILGVTVLRIVLTNAMSKRAKAAHPAIHVLLVRLGFKTAGDRDEWARCWAPLAKKVYKDEPNCLSYELCKATDSNDAIIYERYVSKGDLDGKHQATLKWFKENNNKKMPQPTKKELTHYTESNIGHMDR